MSHRRHALDRRRTLEGDNSVEAVGGPDAHQRTASQHSRHYAANVDPASAGTGARWNPRQASGEKHAALRPLLDLQVRPYPAARAERDLQMGQKPPQASQQGIAIRDATSSRPLEQFSSRPLEQFSRPGAISSSAAFLGLSFPKGIRGLLESPRLVWRRPPLRNL